MGETARTISRQYLRPSTRWTGRLVFGPSLPSPPEGDGLPSRPVRVERRVVSSRARRVDPGGGRGTQVYTGRTLCLSGLSRDPSLVWEVWRVGSRHTV